MRYGKITGGSNCGSLVRRARWYDDLEALVDVGLEFLIDIRREVLARCSQEMKLVATAREPVTTLHDLIDDFVVLENI